MRQAVDSLKRRLKLPKSPLAAAFAHLKPDWRAFISYVEIAAREGDTEMDKLLVVYRSMNRREQLSATPEFLCDVASVSVEDLIAAVTPLLWRYSNLRSTVITALGNPQVIEKTLKSAMSPFGDKDRITFLKVSGALPQSRGTQILNMPVGQVGSAGSLTGSNAPLPRLPSAGQDVLELEAHEADDLD